MSSNKNDLGIALKEQYYEQLHGFVFVVSLLYSNSNSLLHQNQKAQTGITYPYYALTDSYLTQ